MAHISEHSPVFVIKNHSNSHKKIDRIVLQSGDEVDLAATLSEFDILKMLTSASPLSDALRSGDVAVVRSTIMQQFGGQAPELQVQAPLRYEGGLLTIDRASSRSAGVLAPEEFGRISAAAGGVRVWLTYTLQSGDGPEISVDLKDPRIIAIHADSAILRSKAHPTRAPGAGFFKMGKSAEVKYLLVDRLVLDRQLTEDAVLWVAATVDKRDAPSMASDPPPLVQVGTAHQRTVSAEAGAYDTLEANAAKFKSIQTEQMSTDMRVPFGYGVTVDGGGRFVPSPFPYVGRSPPHEAYDGMIWHKLPDYRQAFWCDADSAWYWCDRRVLQFDGAHGLIESSGLGYRTAACEGRLDRLLIEAQGKTSISIAVDGKTAHTAETNGCYDQYLNIAVSPTSRIKLFQDSDSAPPFVAQLFIRIRAA